MHLAIVFLCVGLHQLVTGEPACSKFSYEESLLEKMIRTEVKFEKVQTEFSALRQELKSTLTEIMQEFKTMTNTFDTTLKEIQKERLDLKDTLEEMNKTTTTKVDEFLEVSSETLQHKERQISRMSQDLQMVYQGIQANITEEIQKASTNAIGFTAENLKNKSPSAEEILVFPDVVSNVGGSYDETTGEFTAPVSGLYLLNVQICHRSSNNVAADIVVADKTVGTVYAYDNKHVECNSGAVVTYIEAGVEAYIKSQWTTSLQHDSYRKASFCGALITKTN